MAPLVFGVVILSCILANRYTYIERDNLTDLYILIFLFLGSFGRKYFSIVILKVITREIQLLYAV